MSTTRPPSAYHRRCRDRTGWIATVLAALVLVGCATGCSLERLALRKVADAMTAGGELYASDDDPELVRDAVPFALKSMEALLAELPEHEGLLLSACQGFAQYAYAFVELDAEQLASSDYRRSEGLRERAMRLYLRARDYGVRGLELRHAGIGRRLATEPETAVAEVGEKDVPLLFWTGAAWGGAISAGRDRTELLADLPAVVALMRRALQLDEDFDHGAIHEVMIALETLPTNLDRSDVLARQHFERAVELSEGLRAGPFVTFAEGVSVARQDRKEFEALLRRALAIDPGAAPASRLQNLIVQRRARLLLERIDELFLE